MKWNQGNPRYRRPGSVGGRRNRRVTARRRGDRPGFWRRWSERFHRRAASAAVPGPARWRAPRWLEKLKGFFRPGEPRGQGFEPGAPPWTGPPPEATPEVPPEPATALQAAAEVSPAAADAPPAAAGPSPEAAPRPGPAEEARRPDEPPLTAAPPAGSGPRVEPPRPNPARPRRGNGRQRRLAILIGLGAALILSAALGLPSFLERKFTGPARTMVEPGEIVSPLPTVASIAPGVYEMARIRLEQTPRAEVTVEEGYTLSRALEELGFAAKAEGSTIVAALEKVELLKVVRPGDRLTARWRDAEKARLARLEYYPADGGRPVAILPDNAGGFWHFDLASPSVRAQEAAEGQVTSTLWEAGAEAGLDPGLIVSLADIMASDIDFLSDVRQGDSFQVLYQREYQDGRPKGPAVIDMVRMTSDGADYEYYRYTDSGGREGYYDPNGLSNKKSFFMSPLQYTRISSGYSLKRLHPIYKRARAHQAVDYAAPSGAPVVSVADGQVIFKGWSGGYGNLVTIKHNETYTTMYAHLSRFPKELRKGARIQQGDLVGYVGATGTATGPHLDFRLKRGSVFVNPVPELARQEGRPIDPVERPRLTQTITSFRTRLTNLLATPK